MKNEIKSKLDLKQKDIITSDDILGKDVLGKDGGILGLVSKVHINKKTKKILGITIDCGFAKPDLYVGVQHVKTFGVDSVLLDINPQHGLRGLGVYDIRGIDIGKVTDVSYKSSNALNYIVVRTGIKHIHITPRHIKTIGNNIILKLTRYQTKELGKK